ncbi:MAG TPA: dihydrolipoamide acetyltransferase family protein [Anaerolineales bacterium]|nr:dihydrolipoamide acetyltransferase family protein [Anaerolineales bacterium]
MATSVIMPALEMAQETGLLVRWLKQDGESVTKGEPLMEIETDKVTLEIEATASGTLGGVLAKEGDVIPVGRTIAWILAAGETPPASAASPTPAAPAFPPASVEVSPVARKIAAENGVNLGAVQPAGRRIEKADVLAFMAARQPTPSPARLTPASPKARRMAAEDGLELATLQGSGPQGAVLAADVLAAKGTGGQANKPEGVGSVWRIMAERTTASWTSVPHFYLVREVDATALVKGRQDLAAEVEKQSGVRLTYTDLLVRLLGFALAKHPHLNAAWEQSAIRWNREINVSLAVAVEDGLVAPVIPGVDRLSLGEIAARRKDLVERAGSRRLRPADVEGGTFTLSNLGMYGVDAFNAIINAPQAAILAVGRIAERVVAVAGQPAVRPTILLSLSCDHRVVDGARGAQFLDELSSLIENPWRSLL